MSIYNVIQSPTSGLQLITWTFSAALEFWKDTFAGVNVTHIGEILQKNKTQSQNDEDSRENNTGKVQLRYISTHSIKRLDTQSGTSAKQEKMKI